MSLLHPISEFMGPTGFDILDGLRKEAIRERDYWAAQKRTIGRFAKDEERLWLRRYRGVCLVIGYIFNPPYLGDCKPPPIATGSDNKDCGTLVWPADLKDEIRWAESAALARILDQKNLVRKP